MNYPTNLVANASDVERLTKAYGSELFARVSRDGPLLFTPSWWDERLMEWSMADEAVKLQLFRFIDVLPQLNSATDINRHLREYFEEAGDALPAWARYGLRWMPRRGVSGRLLAWTARNNAQRLARRFISGSNVDEALQAVAELRGNNFAFTVDLLGEATITEAEAVEHQQEYLRLIEGLSESVNRWPEIGQIDVDEQGELPRVNVSIKLTSLYSQFDPIDPVGASRVVGERLRPILRAARERRAFINIDMEQYVYKDLTIRIFKEMLEEEEFRDWGDVGIAIQAYLTDCQRDLEELLAWVRRRGTPVWVRLIKGAYWDYETIVAEQEGWEPPVFQQKAQTDANYERCTQFILQNHDWLRPAFGSHNIRSLAFALANAQMMGLPQRSYEIQMLYGMAGPIKDVLTDMGYRVRIYTPYGQLLPGMAYLVRRLLENTANDSFLRASFTEHVPEEQLLMSPQSAQQRQARHGENGDAGKKEELFRNEPLSDFSQEDARTAMQGALQDVRQQFGRLYPLVIDGATRRTEATMESVNPSHKSEVVGRCAAASVDDARDAVAAAKKAWPAWRDTSVDGRADYLERAADIMRKRRLELAAWELHECGKQWREADADVAEAIDFCVYYAREMRKMGKPQRHDLAGEENEYFYEPRGVAVVIAPWNFPLAILCGMTSAALVTGNTVVMKPAEQSSVVGAKLMEIYQEAGIPDGVLNYLPGEGEEIGPTLVEHPEVSMIAFTGSRGVGVLINRQAAEQQANQTHVKRVLAEMGGKNGIIIDSDADLDEAVSGVVKSAFGYQGQKCSACSRVIVLEEVYEAFLGRVVEASKSLSIAPSEDPGCKVGPVINEEARERILGFIDQGKQESRLVYAGEVGALADQGYFVGPHIFADVAPTATIAREEIFGPVLAVMKARDLDEALAIANGTDYALTGGVFSRSPEHIERVKREFRVGNLYINRSITGALVARQPFGGFKMSGIGYKAGGPDYLLQFVVARNITENTMRRGFAPPPEE